MSDLLILYIAIAVVLAIVSASVLLCDDELSRGIGAEGRVVLGVLSGLLWGAFVPVVIAWLARAALRGVAQVWRLAVPRRPEVPRARVRRQR